jgi:hypothetical protein
MNKSDLIEALTEKEGFKGTEAVDIVNLILKKLGNNRQTSKNIRIAVKLNKEREQNKKVESRAMENQNEIDDTDNQNDRPSLRRNIRTQASDPTIKDLCDRIDKGRLNLQADFQRQYVWKDKPKVKSKLIESVFLEVPIPTIYTAEEEDGKEVVIDGQQRLMTFSNFLNNEFRLTGLEVRKELNHKNFKTLGDIDPSYQEKIENYPLRVIKFLKDSDVDVRFDIFERLNRGSVQLNDQELRNCMYRGVFNDFIKIVAEDKDFQILLGSKKKIRMQDDELVLRFFTLYDRTYLKYKSPMKDFLTNFMKDYRNVDSIKVNEFKKIFKQTVNLVKTVFGAKAFYLYSNKDSMSGKYENVINKGLFDVLMNGFTRYDQHQVMPHKDALKEELFWLMNNDEFFDVITGAGTDSKKKLEKKFDIWLSSLKTILGYPENESRYFSWAFKNRLWERSPVCSICGQKIEQLDDSEIDHIEFYWRGGKTIPENARLSHRFCNRSRKKKDSSIILRKHQDSEVKAEIITEVENNIREKIHFILVAGKNDYWGSLIPDTVRNKVSERIKNEIALHPYEKDKFNSHNEKLTFCDIRDYKKIILNNWRMFEKIFYSRTELEKHFDNLAEYRNKDRHGRIMDNVTRKGGEAAIEWIGRILESI